MPIDTYPAPVQSTPGAVLGYSAASADQTLTTQGVITGLATTVYAQPGRMIRVRAFARVQNLNAAVNMAWMNLQQDGVTVQTSDVYLTATGAVGGDAGVFVEWIVTPTTGVHTYQVVLNASVWNVKVLGTGGNVPFIIVEDISGGAGGPGPIQLGYAEVTVNQGTFTAETDLTGLSVTVTVPAGRRLKITGSGFFGSSIANDVIRMPLQEDGVQVASSAEMSPASPFNSHIITTAIRSPAAGTHTYKLRAARDSGTGNITMAAQTIFPAFLLVEDITGTPSPAGVMPTSQLLGYNQATANQAGITTEADLTGLAVTITVPDGRRIRITSEMYFQNSSVNTNAGARLFIKEGTTYLQQSDARLTAASVPEKFTASIVVTPSAGTHTYKLAVDNGAGGSVTMVAGAAYPAYILVEDITGGAPAVPAVNVPVGLLGQTTSATVPTTATATDVDLGASLNVSVPAGRTLKATARMRLSGSTAGDVIKFKIKMDGTEIANSSFYADTNWGTTAIPLVGLVSPAAGSHTFTCTFQRETGTGTTTSQGVDILMVEDVTPTPATSTGAPGSTLGIAQPATFVGSSNAAGGVAYFTAEADIPNTSVTVTVPAGRRLRLSAQVLVIDSVTDDEVRVHIKEGATYLQTAAHNTLANSFVTFATSVIITPSAGTHTYNLRMVRQSGTGNVQYYQDAAQIPVFLLVEDITGSVWPTGSSVTAGMVASEPWSHTYNPVVQQPTSSLALLSVVYTSYIKIGRTVIWSWRCQLNATGTSGQILRVVVPVPPYSPSGQVCGSGWFYDASATRMYEGSWIFESGAAAGWLNLVTDETAGNAWGIVPAIAADVNDQISGHIIYEAAS